MAFTNKLELGCLHLVSLFLVYSHRLTVPGRRGSLAEVGTPLTSLGNSMSSRLVSTYSLDLLEDEVETDLTSFSFTIWKCVVQQNFLE